MKKNTEKIATNWKTNQEKLQQAFQGCFDVVIRQVKTKAGKEALVVFSDGLVKKELVETGILRPLLGFALDLGEAKIKKIKEIQQSLLPALDVRPEPDFKKAVLAVLSGDTALFLDGATEALVVQTRGWQSRGIAPPRIQQSVRGAREGFTETLLFNAAMLRRKIHSEKLKMEILKLGKITQTDVCIAYIEGVCNPALVREVKQRLGKINVQYILESGHIEQLVEDQKTTIFATIGNNEKPDVVAAKLIKGRVAILVDGTPFVLTVPMLFLENFQAEEDYYSRPFYANFIRLIRVFSYLVAIVLPALYVALAMHHQELIPDRLVEVMIDSGKGLPTSVAVEMFAMLILYEVLREALVRLPSLVGSSVGMVGVFIIGEAAVNVRLIGGIAVVVAAVTFIASAVVNSTTDSSTLIRFFLLALASFFGIFGILAGVFLLIAHLCALCSFGYPYLMPFAPLRMRGLEDSVFRVGMRRLLKRDGL